METAQRSFIKDSLKELKKLPVDCILYGSFCLVFNIMGIINYLFIEGDPIYLAVAVGYHILFVIFHPRIAIEVRPQEKDSAEEKDKPCGRCPGCQLSGGYQPCHRQGSSGGLNPPKSK